MTSIVSCVLRILIFFFSCNYFSQEEITTLGSVGGPDIIWDVVVGMEETQYFFWEQPGSVKFGVS